jgi:hypothetical protein
LVSFEDFASRVGRTVVYYDKLDVLVGLRQKASDRLFEVLNSIVGRHYYGNEFRHDPPNLRSAGPRTRVLT